MKNYAKIFGLLFVIVCIASMVFSACRKDIPEVEPEPVPPDTTYNGYNNDSVGLEITDSITVVFGDSHWKTLSYTSRIERDTTTNHFEWVYIDAHYPGAEYPRFELKILNELGEHTGWVSVSSPTGVYTIPGNSLAGDIKCGNLKYYSNDSVMLVLHMPDGTVRANWWADTLKTQVLNYNARESRLTGRCSGVMFDYMQWFLAQKNGTPINVAAARKKPIAISFGGLQVVAD